MPITKKKYRKRPMYGKDPVLPGTSRFGGAVFHWISKAGRYRMTDRAPKKSEIITKTAYEEIFGPLPTKTKKGKGNIKKKVVKRRVQSIVISLKKSCKVSNEVFEKATEAFVNYLKQTKWGYTDGYDRQLKKCGAFNVYYFVRLSKVGYAKRKLENILKVYKIKSKVNLSVTNIYTANRTDNKYIKWS